MAHRDEELADVVVVLEDGMDLTIEQAVSKLKEAGLSVTEVDSGNGVVEGTLPSANAHSLKSMPFVKYVRNVFNYNSETQDGNSEDDELEPDVDDAGA